jgi:hypothetical protein
MHRPAPDARTARHTAPGPYLRRVALAAALAWLLLAVASLAVGDTVGMAAAGAVLGGVVAAVALARARAFRLDGRGRRSVPTRGARRPRPWYRALTPGDRRGAGRVLHGNPNVLGAALVTAMAAWAAVSPGRRWVWWAWPIVALAVLNTGSRTSGGALLARAPPGWCCWRCGCRADGCWPRSWRFSSSPRRPSPGSGAWWS